MSDAASLQHDPATTPSSWGRGRPRRGPGAPRGPSGSEYWRSLDELAETPSFQEFLRKEFPRQAAPLEASLDRRDFLKLLGASLALGGLTACARPPAARDERSCRTSRRPSIACRVSRRSTRPRCSTAATPRACWPRATKGARRTSRATPTTPPASARSTPIGSAAVLSLYDPDRSQQLAEGGQARSWPQFADALGTALAALPDGSGCAPDRDGHVADAGGRDRRAARGAPGRPPPPVGPAARRRRGRRFARRLRRRRRRRRAGLRLQPRRRRGLVRRRLHEHRSRPAPVRQGLRAPAPRAERRGLHEPAVDGGDHTHPHRLRSPTTARRSRPPTSRRSPPGSRARSASPTPAADLPARVERAWADALVADLQEARGRSAVVAGSDQPAVVHALAHALNHALDNVGATVRYVAHPRPRPPTTATTWRRSPPTCGRRRRRARDPGRQPGVHGPAELDFAAALARARSASTSANTSTRPVAPPRGTCRAPTPSRRGATRARSTAPSRIQQPLFAPFYGGRSDLEVLQALLGRADRSGYDVIREAWQARVSGDFDAFWRRALYRGVLEGTRRPVGRGGAPADRPAAAARQPTWTLHFQLDYGSSTAATPTTAGSRSSRPVLQADLGQRRHPRARSPRSASASGRTTGS
jgi:MoCo/4Fe-4S cofactor protein with predicted Tat translocation signal